MAKFEILRSDKTTVTIEIGKDQKMATSEAWKEFNRVGDDGTYAVLMRMVDNNDKQIECANVPATFDK